MAGPPVPPPPPPYLRQWRRGALQLSDIYDAVIAKMTTSGDRKILAVYLNMLKINMMTI